MLLCTVRGCRRPLAREERRVICPRGHSFDIARSGYINLLQPQERRSKNPGDTLEAVAGRRRLHDLGVTEPLRRAIVELASPSTDDVALDAGCGDGFYASAFPHAQGIDISIPAIESAAKRYPECEWIVGNADRCIPYADRSFSLILSITGRVNAAEFRRTLRDDGRLLVALPAPDDLIELRGTGRDRSDRTVDGFTLMDQRRVTTQAELDAAAVQDVLHSIYRPLRAQPADAMRVTFSLDLLLFRKKARV